MTNLYIELIYIQTIYNQLRLWLKKLTIWHKL